MNETKNETGSLYTIQQLVKKLQVSDETIYRHIRSGRLNAVKVGCLWRVSPEALADFEALSGIIASQGRSSRDAA